MSRRGSERGPVSHCVEALCPGCVARSVPVLLVFVLVAAVKLAVLAVVVSCSRHRPGGESRLGSAGRVFGSGCAV